jgi:hypothetical protein
VIDLKLDLVPASAPTRAPSTLCKAAVTLTAACGHLRRPPARADLALDNHPEAQLEGQENVPVDAQCHRPLGGAIATARPTHGLSALDPVPPPRTARRGDEPGPLDVQVPCRCGGSTILIGAGRQRALHPRTIDLADRDIELKSACSVGDGR